MPICWGEPSLTMTADQSPARSPGTVVCSVVPPKAQVSPSRAAHSSRTVWVPPTDVVTAVPDSSRHRRRRRRLWWRGLRRAGNWTVPPTGVGDGLSRGSPARPARSGGAEELATDDEDRDHGGGAEAERDELVHVGHPPRADDDPLSFAVRWWRARRRRPGPPARSVPPSGSRGSGDRGLGARSCQSLLGIGGRPGVSFDAGPERPRGVVQAGLRGPDGKSGSFRHLGDRESEVVVEDQDGALFDGEPPEGPLEQVAVVHGQVLVAGRTRPRREGSSGPRTTACDAWPRRSTRW